MKTEEDKKIGFCVKSAEGGKFVVTETKGVVHPLPGVLLSREDLDDLHRTVNYIKVM